MKVRYFLLVAVALVLLTGCHRDASALLERAEAYLPSQPDSAEVCLDSIGQPQRLNDAQKAWYGLLRTYVDNRQGKGVDSDSLIRDSYEYYLPCRSDLRHDAAAPLCPELLLHGTFL